MGDFNAKVGDERVKDFVGPSGIRTVNERGSSLIESCQINDFTFKTILGDSGLGRAPEIEVETKKITASFRRFRNAVKTSKSLPGADCDSDHIPVMCKIQIILKKLRKAKTNPKFQMELLKSDEKLKDKYETLKNSQK
ncbi:craniofacial development protein 2-like [Plakobranchus ocellatus]|uniref:Craniofacial development protein 2-like n=1 Tax=Plakobranchus ocellatus TaxID=259542 RepID=A0AAV4DYF2_9GAST|nr:craniofacial development protein 2-like [Plakobranchus ocellatus]